MTLGHPTRSRCKAAPARHPSSPPWLAALAALTVATSAAAQAKPEGEAPPATTAPAPSSAQPPPGYPPPGYPPPGYPPPGYPPPPGYYPVPYYVPVHAEPPAWKPGEPAPPGYHVDTRMDVKTLRSGVSLLAFTWIVSVVAGAILNEAEDEGDDDVDPGDWSTLYVPVVGPFLTMRNTSTDDAGWAFLLLDGVLQSGATIMIVVGLTSREEYLVRNTARRRRPSLAVVPVVGTQHGGLGLVGRF